MQINEAKAQVLETQKQLIELLNQENKELREKLRLKGDSCLHPVTADK